MWIAHPPNRDASLSSCDNDVHGFTEAADQSHGRFQER